MTQNPPPLVFLKDYEPPAWRVDTIELDVSFLSGYVRIESRLRLVRNPLNPQEDCRLHGEALQLEAIALDGQPLAPSRYVLSEEGLRLAGPLPDAFMLTTVVRVDADHNFALSGLYRSKDGYFTQCEAEGFRRITFYPDRPDVMARFSCRIEADREKLPVLLSNGNLAGTGTLPQGRHWALWIDPFPKPSYLFALVAAKLDVLEDEYVTASGRRVRLAVYVEPGKSDQCQHAMAALKKAMRWDEETYGLECDLDHYMIVAVGDFNMGAMENKGLNVFNTKYVLARPDTATDTDYQNIDRVVAHEYFHNWTGNRVTCRDWFQLTLKEGLTVHRDQRFGEDVHARAVSRIQEVRLLRTSQFPEDAGPMAHPVRPAFYAEIDNFYTATVYEKGAAVVRMLETLIGREAFRRGLRLYLRRHDGAAATCEDFVSAMEEASGMDLAQFRRWYGRAGTPRLIVSGRYDAASQRYFLTLRQKHSPTAYERRLVELGLPVEEGPLHIPVAVGLVGPAGEELLPEGTRVLSLTAEEETFVFEGVEKTPVASVLRDFSAPVHLEFEQSEEELACLFAYDADAINRWDAGQRLMTRVLLAGVSRGGADSDWVPSRLIDACARLLDDGECDPAFVAEALQLPSESILSEEIAARGEIVDPDAVHATRIALRRVLAQRLYERMETLWQRLAPVGPYRFTSADVGRRALRNTLLALLAEADAQAQEERLWTQLVCADNMTDVYAALSILTHYDLPARERALSAFYERWREEALVVDKWLSVQAVSRLATAATVRALMAHPAFELKNPNKVYALVRSFCAQNLRAFHAADGSGYALAVEVVAQLAQFNPQVAARIVRAFDRWRIYDAGRREKAQAALDALARQPDLASEVAEVVANLLGG
ncbi:MAG: aminopeptidase N [Rhodocyclaceae bacterium]|nr:aminopeptidase N [Rhodocyclaceae bacterium]